MTKKKSYTVLNICIMKAYVRKKNQINFDLTTSLTSEKKCTIVTTTIYVNIFIIQGVSYVIVRRVFFFNDYGMI